PRLRTAATRTLTGSKTTTCRWRPTSKKTRSRPSHRKTWRRRWPRWRRSSSRADRHGRELEQSRERGVDERSIVRLRGENVDVRARGEHAHRRQLARRELDDAREPELGDRIAKHPDGL